MHPVHKQAESKPDIAFYHPFIPEASFIVAALRMFHNRIISFRAGLAPNSYHFIRFPSVYGSLMGPLRFTW